MFLVHSFETWVRVEGEELCSFPRACGGGCLSVEKFAALTLQEYLLSVPQDNIIEPHSVEFP